MRSVIRFSLALGLIGSVFGYAPSANAQAVSERPIVDSSAATEFDRGFDAFEKGDYKTAAKKFKQAADQGFADAQNNLGVMHKTGLGVPQNFVQAHKWYNLAAASGDTRAPAARDSVAEKMTSAQIAEAQRLASEWRKNEE